MVLQVLVLHFTPRTVLPGERIIRSGDKADSVYFISSGQVEVSVAGKRMRRSPSTVWREAEDDVELRRHLAYA